MNANEHTEQVALFKWAEYASGRWPMLELLYAIPNGGVRPARERIDKRGKKVRYSVEAQKLRTEGVKPGVPDICLPVASGTFHGLYIELKTLTGSPSEAQRCWVAALVRQGYRAEVCRGWEQARRVIEDYLGPVIGTATIQDLPGLPAAYPASCLERMGDCEAERMSS